MCPLEGKAVFVAGAGTGMGLATAIMAAQAGANVLIFGRRIETLEKANEQIAAAGRGQSSFYAGDATREDEVRAAVEVCCSRYGRVDVAVNSVGTNVRERSLSQLTSSSWNDLITGNLGAAYAITQAVLPTFRLQRSGLLIHISSSAAKKADGSGAGYQASKAGVAALAAATMFEERSNGVRVTVIFPGFTNTPFIAKRPTPPTEAELAQALKPEDIARMCVAIMELPPGGYVPELSLYPTNL